jgi:hypothetical protein
MAYIFIDDSIPAVDHEAITVSTSALGLTASKLTAFAAANARDTDQSYVDIKRAHKVLITTETDKVRFRLDGTDPTSATGHELAAGDSLEVAGFSNLSKLRFIRSGAADATLRVTFYRRQ